MMKKILVSACLIVGVLARENPFVPYNKEAALPAISQKGAQEAPFRSVSIAPKKEARILKEVVLTFQNVDGSMDSRTVEIDKMINWREPLILSQVATVQKQTANLPKKVASKSSFVHFRVAGNTLSVLTKGKILRHFPLGVSGGIAVDINHSGVFESYEEELNTAPYGKVKVVDHGAFARVTVILDAQRVCSVYKGNSGANIVCK